MRYHSFSEKSLESSLITESFYLNSTYLPELFLLDPDGDGLSSISSSLNKIGVALTIAPETVAAGVESDDGKRSYSADPPFYTEGEEWGSNGKILRSHAPPFLSDSLKDEFWPRLKLAKG